MHTAMSEQRDARAEQRLRIHGREDGLLGRTIMWNLVPPHGQFAKMRRDACLFVADIWFFQIEATQNEFPAPVNKNRADGVIDFGGNSASSVLWTPLRSSAFRIAQIENNLRNAVFDDIDDAAVIGFSMSVPPR